MIQIMGIRHWKNAEGKDCETDSALFDKGYRANSVQELFANLTSILKEIPKKEQYNLFFTAAECTDKKREFHAASVVWFDIDGIETARIPEYVEIFLATWNLKENETGIVASGRGLHFYVGLKTPIVNKKYFSETRDNYKALLTELGENFTSKGLPHKLDASVWDARRLMRLPGTKNKKPGKAEAECVLLQAHIEPIDFDIVALSRIPVVEKGESLDAKSLAVTFTADPKAVFQGCEFLKYCKSHASEVSEPEWYAALSIVARFPNGNEEAHTLSRGHPGYTYEETERKIEQALKSSGPRTCKNIQNTWGACTKCPHYEKVSSPILIRDPNEIRTEKTGFFHYHADKNGVMKRGEPDYEGLVKFFRRSTPYKCTAKSCYTYTGTHYELFDDEKLAGFAQSHFKPICRNFMVAEFQAMIQRTELVQANHWASGVSRKVNFKNGVLDIDTMELQPHSPDFLFKYVLPYDYDSRAVAPVFSRFLNEVTGGDKTLADTLLEFGGYALAGEDCRYQKALVLEGEGSNGKSTFIETIKAVAGERGYCALSFQDLNSLERRTPLDGALFNITEETPRELFDTTQFKNLVSGGELQVRHLYKANYTIRNRAKLIFSCNELPLMPDTSNGMYRRVLIVPFKKRFSREQGNLDLQIGKKMEAELPGIFNLFLEGYKRLEKEGTFTKSTLGEDLELKAYQSLTDPVQYWLDECVTIGEEGESTVQNLYKSYAAFCLTNGYERKTLPSNVFGKRLRALLKDYEERFSITMRDGKKVRLLKGVSTEIHGEEDY